VTADTTTNSVTSNPSSTRRNHGGFPVGFFGRNADAAAAHQSVQTFRHSRRRDAFKAGAFAIGVDARSDEPRATLARSSNPSSSAYERAGRVYRSC